MAVKRDSHNTQQVPSVPHVRVYASFFSYRFTWVKIE